MLHLSITFEKMAIIFMRKFKLQVGTEFYWIETRNISLGLVMSHCDDFSGSGSGLATSESQASGPYHLSELSWRRKDNSIEYSQTIRLYWTLGVYQKCTLKPWSLIIMKIYVISCHLEPKLKENFVCYNGIF